MREDLPDGRGTGLYGRSCKQLEVIAGFGPGQAIRARIVTELTAIFFEAVFFCFLLVVEQCKQQVNEVIVDAA